MTNCGEYAVTQAESFSLSGSQGPSLSRDDPPKPSGSLDQGQVSVFSCSHSTQGLTGVGQRAQLTRVAPSPTQGATAGGPGDANPDLHTAGNATVPSILYVQETVPDPGI